MAVWEAGYKNIVSVPSGSNNFTWIDNCWEWLQKLSEIIIWADNDGPGQKMASELQIRLGKYRTKIITHKHKDANEVLFYHGSEEVISFIDRAIKQTPTGILDMSQVEYCSAKDVIENGVPTGFFDLDYILEDLQPCCLSVVFGRSGEGKSTWISQVVCNCIDNRIPVFLYSGEMGSQRILNWLYKQVIGDDEKYLENVRTKYKLKKEYKLDTYILKIKIK
jgi:twinkle protein